MKVRIYFLTVAVILCIITSTIMPHGDDFLYLNYFDNHTNWGIKGYQWVGDNILLPRGYWRPWEDLLGRFCALTPGTFPYLNHVLISIAHTICGYLVYKISKLLMMSHRSAIYASLFFMLSATAMGGLLSIDSIAQVLVSLFGLLSVYSYCQGSPYGKLLWLVFSICAILSKESGFVWTIVGPLLKEILIQKERDNLFLFSKVRWKPLFITLSISSLVIFIYLIAFYLLKPDVFNILRNNDIPQQAYAHVSNSVVSLTGQLTDIEHQSTFKMTPAGFVKNLFVLYGASIFPVDTSALYYKMNFIVFLTIILSLFGLLFFIQGLKNAYRKDPQLLWGVILLLLWTSSVSLITRAGEISPHPSNAFVAILFGLAINEIRWNKVYLLSILCFILSTIITGVHKFYLCYTAGNLCTEMGKEVVAKTKDKPQKVLCITLDEKRKDGTFIVNTASDFSAGGPALMLYNYKYPKYREIMQISKKDFSNQQFLDSIINGIKKTGEYDCVWLQNEEKIDVINF